MKTCTNCIFNKIASRLWQKPHIFQLQLAMKTKCIAFG